MFSCRLRKKLRDVVYDLRNVQTNLKQRLYFIPSMFKAYFFIICTSYLRSWRSISFRLDGLIIRTSRKLALYQRTRICDKETSNSATTSKSKIYIAAQHTARIDKSRRSLCTLYAYLASFKTSTRTAGYFGVHITQPSCWVVSRQAVDSVSTH